MNDHVVAPTDTVDFFVDPDTNVGFATYDAVNANDDVPANVDVFEPVYVLNAVVSNFPVPTVCPFRLKDPVILREPVKL